MQNLKYFTWSIGFTLFGLVGGYLLGGWPAAFIVAVLAVLETSLSFDNAVVNATVLRHMDEKWRQRFLLWGILIAVFGMRIVFPLAIVGVVASMGPVEVVDLALFNPDEYARLLTSANPEMAAFGRMEAAQILLTLLAILATSAWMDGAEKRMEFIVAGVWGLVVYIIADGLGAIMGGEEGEGGRMVAKTGFAGFMYLELLDASFSFDGVIGAFALTTSLPIIAIGLGVGAMFVRSFTLMLVYRGTLEAYRYLEHGAFWAIGALAAIMFIGVHMHIPETFTGLIGAVLIGAAFWSSLRHNRLSAGGG